MHTRLKITDSGRIYPTTILTIPLLSPSPAICTTWNRRVSRRRTTNIRIERREDTGGVCLPDPGVQIVVRGLARLMLFHGTIKRPSEYEGRWRRGVGNGGIRRSDREPVFDPKQFHPIRSLEVKQDLRFKDVNFRIHQPGRVDEVDAHAAQPRFRDAMWSGNKPVRQRNFHIVILRSRLPHFCQIAKHCRVSATPVAAYAMPARASKSNTATPRDKTIFFMVPPILVRPVIIFSETRVGSCAHTVANHPFTLVTQTVTKSVTIIGNQNSCSNSTHSATGSG